jgi:phage/plasmid-associated DNA primase
MVPHDPKYLTVNQFPYEFRPRRRSHRREAGNAVCHFLDVSLADEVDQEAFWEFLGYSMTADTCFQKFIMIRGPGGTGKSVLISLMEHLVGPENCTSITIQDLNKRFYATELFGMLLNACADIPSSAMLNVDVLKKAVGEDMLLYEKEGKGPCQVLQLRQADLFRK